MTPDMKRLCEAAWKAEVAANDAYRHVDDGYDESESYEHIVRAVLMAMRDVSNEIADAIDYEAAFHNPNEQIGRGHVQAVLEAAVDRILADPAKA